MFRRKSRQYEKTNSIDIDDEPDGIAHPLDSNSIYLKILHWLFHIWVFRLVTICSKPNLDTNDLPKLPQYQTVSYSYKNWNKIYDERKNENLSTTTLSMIYHTEKRLMITLLIFMPVATCILSYIIFVIAQSCLWPLFNNDNMKANNNNFEFIQSAIIYSILHFVCAFIRCLLASLSIHLNNRICVRINASLKYILFKKLLSLNLNEPNKQQLLNIIGSDLRALRGQLLGLLTFAPRYFVLFILTIYVIFKLYGISAVFGILFMICIGFPCQLIAGIKFAKYQKLRMDASDKRVELITELIAGIRHLKCSASEIAFMNKINEYRLTELQYVKTTQLFFAFLFLLNFVIPAITICIVLIVNTFVFNKKLKSQDCLWLIMIMIFAQSAVKVFPLQIGFISSLLVTTKRIDTFLEKKIIEKKNIDINCNVKQTFMGKNIIIQIHNASFRWSSDNKNDNKNDFMLKNINLKISKGKLIGIIGSVGSGKTSLFEAIIGEMECINGNINYNNNIQQHGFGYCSQNPYIRSATLRDNIIMNLEYNQEKYKKCIFASCIYLDLKQLPNGDLTLIGTEGVNISGGQTMRIVYARTLYRKDEYDLFLFDDPLSSVDIYVGKKMFFNGIINYLQLKENNKTCLMTINSHLYLLQYFDEIIIVENGQIKLHSKSKDLLSNSNNLYKKYSHLLPKINNDIDIKCNILDNIDDDNKEIDNHIDINDTKHIFNNLYLHEQKQLIPPGFGVCKQIIKYSLLDQYNYQDEFYDIATAQTNHDHNNNSLLIMKIVFVIFILFCIQSSFPLCDIWILFWSKKVETEPNHSHTSALWYLGIWFILLLVIAFASFASIYYINNILIRSSWSIFTKTFLNILKCNTLFYDIIPRGQLLNILTADTNTMDNNVQLSVFQTITICSAMCGFFVANIFIIPSVLPLFIFVVFPISFIFIRKFIKCYYRCVVLSEISLSPILSLFNDVMHSLDSIRCLKLENYFLNMLQEEINIENKCIYSYANIYAWFTLYHETFLMICLLFVSIWCGITILYFNQKKDIHLVLLSIWWFNTLFLYFGNFALALANLQKYTLSIQRMLFYCDQKNIESIYKSQKQKNAKYKNSYFSSNKWPINGDITIKRLQLRYRENFDIALDINKEINIKPGTKLAIVGRTGSGKSSIFASIFRLFEPSKDSNVSVDKLNIYDLGLFDVRNSMSIIMQKPRLYNGSLRFNLDPFNEYSDIVLWNALKDVQVFNIINSRKNKLDCNVEANGSNFSVGEQQLICFARAICQKSHVLFMDEPTSSIDKATDSIIQKLIRSNKFKNTTVICIAHRLQTILDYDYILLLKNGKIAEYDTPKQLLDNKNSNFYALVQMDINLSYH